MTKPNKKILIVDDDADIRNSIRLALEEQDYVNAEITESPNVDEAVQQVKDNAPDIIIFRSAHAR